MDDEELRLEKYRLDIGLPEKIPAWSIIAFPTFYLHAGRGKFSLFVLLLKTSGTDKNTPRAVVFGIAKTDDVFPDAVDPDNTYFSYVSDINQRMTTTTRGFSIWELGWNPNITNDTGIYSFDAFRLHF